MSVGSQVNNDLYTSQAFSYFDVDKTIKNDLISVSKQVCLQQKVTFFMWKFYFLDQPPLSLCGHKFW